MKNFAYIDHKADLTQQMVDLYKNAFILFGDEQQLYNPLTNSYVGIGMTAYNNLLELIRAAGGKTVFHEIVDRNEDFKVTFNNVTKNEYGTAYTSSSLKYNPNKKILTTSYFKGDLIGNSYTSTYSYISYTSYIRNTGVNQSYYISFSNTNEEGLNSYSFVNNDLKYNPHEKTLMVPFLDGQVDPEDQWGIMGSED